MQTREFAYNTIKSKFQQSIIIYKYNVQEYTLSVYEPFSNSRLDMYDWYLVLSGDSSDIAGCVTIGFGCVDVCHSVEECKFIADLWNFNLKKGIGTILLHQAINLLQSGQHMLNSTSEWSRNAFEKWKLFDPAIKLLSTLESMTFYYKNGFRLTKPNELIYCIPFATQFTPDLEALVEMSELPDYLKEARNFSVEFTKALETGQLSGMKHRFSKGVPTEQDWYLLTNWIGLMGQGYLWYDMRQDYELLVQNFPDLTDYLDMSAFLKPSSTVLENELENYKTMGRRSGFHYSIEMQYCDNTIKANQ